ICRKKRRQVAIRMLAASQPRMGRLMDWGQGSTSAETGSRSAPTTISWIELRVMVGMRLATRELMLNMMAKKKAEVRKNNCPASARKPCWRERQPNPTTAMGKAIQVVGGG